MLEDIDDKLAFIVEGHQGLNSRFGGVESRLSGVESHLEGVESRLAVVEIRLEGVETRLGTVETRVASVERKVDVLTDTVGEIKIELTEVNEKLDRKVDRSEFNRLDRQVSVLEAAK